LEQSGGEVGLAGWMGMIKRERERVFNRGRSLGNEIVLSTLSLAKHDAFDDYKALTETFADSTSWDFHPFACMLANRIPRNFFKACLAFILCDSALSEFCTCTSAAAACSCPSLLSTASSVSETFVLHNQNNIKHGWLPIDNALCPGRLFWLCSEFFVAFDSAAAVRKKKEHGKSLLLARIQSGALICVAQETGRR
jgi:hypothetical protein